MALDSSTPNLADYASKIGAALRAMRRMGSESAVPYSLTLTPRQKAT
jgi:hypothetical protein